MTVAVLRRWYVFLPLMILTGFGAYTVGEGVQPQYEVTATAVLVPGTVESEIDNPYGTMNSTADVVAIVLDGPTTRDAVEARGLNPGYEVDTRSQSSILDVTVLGDTQQQSTVTAGAVLEMARQELSQRQDAVGVPDDAQIKLQVLREPALSEVVTEGKTRNMAVVGVLGASLSLIITLLFDDIVGLLRRRSRRRAERRARHEAQQDEERRGEEQENHARLDQERRDGERGDPERQDQEPEERAAAPQSSAIDAPDEASGNPHEAGSELPTDAVNGREAATSHGRT